MSPKKQAEDRFKNVDADSSSTARAGSIGRATGALSKHRRKIENPFAEEFVPPKKPKRVPISKPATPASTLTPLNPSGRGRKVWGGGANSE